MSHGIGTGGKTTIAGITPAGDKTAVSVSSVGGVEVAVATHDRDLAEEVRMLRAVLERIELLIMKHM